MPDVTSAPRDRITTALVPKAATDLERLQERTGRGKTDLVNRAISLYEFIERQVTAGAVVLVRHGDETQQVQLL